jgi:ketosteroid isomerase-like protein
MRYSQSLRQPPACLKVMEKMARQQSAPESAKVETESLLRQLNDEWVKAVVRRDVTTLDRIMADDFVSAYPLEGDDKAQILNDLASGTLRVEYLNRENVSVRIWGNTAILTGRDSAKWFYLGREWSGNYKIIHIYSQRDNEWKLVAFQACPMT